MQILLFFLSQLFSYSILTWVLFIAVAFCCARHGGWAGAIAGHVLVAFLITFLDVQWIQGEMNAPGWDGLPDMDFVFYIGLLIRIVLINFVLLPVNVLAVRIRSKQRRSPQAKTGT